MEIQSIVMPAEPNVVGKPTFSVAAHEIGHALGLPDLFGDALTGSHSERPSVGAWDLMADESGVPHFTMAQKIRMGWIRKEKIKCIRLQAAAANTETVWLHPSRWAALEPPPLDYAAIEIRLGVGHNYMVELRQAADPLYNMADQRLPVGRAALVTEVDGRHVQPIVTMAPSEGDGPVLSDKMEFWARDPTDPANPLALRIRAGTFGELIVIQGMPMRPDPSIRKEDGSYHSPDLFVRNARNWDGMWINGEWKYDAFADNPNWLVATIWNEGNLDAPGVQVKFEFTRSGVDENWNQIGSLVTNDVPTKSRRTFVSDLWIPDSGAVLPEQHYRVRATIVGNADGFYEVPGSNPPIVEATKSNNQAHSNLQRMVSDTASPSSRIAQRLVIANPTETERILKVQVSQTNPLYRSFVEHSWMRIAAGASREVLVMSEFVGTDAGGQLHPDDRYEPNRLVVEAYLLPDEVYDSTRLIGGSQIVVVEGRAVRFGRLEAIDVGGEVQVRGRVVVKNGGAIPPSGSIILTIGVPGGLENRTLPLENGTFSASLPRAGWDWVRAYFVPPAGYGDATSETIRRPEDGRSSRRAAGTRGEAGGGRVHGASRKR